MHYVTTIDEVLDIALSVPAQQRVVLEVERAMSQPVG
jgi:hypothetical protein